MVSMAITLLCLQTIALAETGRRFSYCSPDMHKKYVKCGEKLCLCSQTVALCQNNGHYNMSYIPRLPDGIENLYFLNNRLSNLTQVTFQNVTRSSIRVLSLINNKIENISDDAFSSFINLQTLCLDQNEDVNKTQLSMSLRRIPASLKFSLHLANMNWNEVSDVFFKNPLALKIVKLDLSGNRMKVVNWSAFQYLTALKELNLSGNKIREMFKAIVHRGLMSLNLGGNKIGHSIPNFYSASNGTPLFPNLTTLHLNDNLISKLHNDSLQCLHQLHYLGLSGNSIRKLKNNVFSELSNLRTLHLAQMASSINDIKPYALNNSKLEKLNLRENSIIFQPNRQLNIFQLSTNLRNLDISKNNLNKLDDGEITTLLGNLKRLEKFTATYTKLSSIPRGLLDVLKNLTDINLDGNGIVNFPKLFNSVKDVRRLSLQGNKIRVVDKSLISEDFLKSLMKLSLAFNPFSCTCENLWFRSVIDEKGMIGNVSLMSWPSYYRCASPADLKNKLLKDYHPTEISCNRKNYLLIVTISLAAIMIVSAVAAVLGYKYRWYVKYWFYKLMSNRRSAEEEPLLERNYDAFLIYNSCDSQYVHHDFRLLLEEENAFKLHMWERDVPAGSDNFHGMVSGMASSRRVIAIISKDSLDDGWFQFQLSVALDRQVELKNTFLILVILENVECEGLSKYWCVLLTRLPTARWCHDKTDVKRAAFKQQLFNHLGSRNIN